MGVIGAGHVYVRVFDDTAFSPWDKSRCVHRELLFVCILTRPNIFTPFSPRKQRHTVFFCGETGPQQKLSACYIQPASSHTVSRMARTFDKSVTRAEFRHVMELGAREAMRLGFEHDAAAAAAVPSGGEDDGDDVGANFDEAEARIIDLAETIMRLQRMTVIPCQQSAQLVEMLLNPTFFSAPAITLMQCGPCSNSRA
ncbi:hypothetical protein M885DRAFT_499195 [Pelagophyceae sp. CCMP2097]|nr:hypothetical protein M885DRAFT_499195 [Pelagophyceae sp. CCMP2097]